MHADGDSSGADKNKRNGTNFHFQSRSCHDHHNPRYLYPNKHYANTCVYGPPFCKRTVAALFT